MSCSQQISNTAFFCCYAKYATMKKNIFSYLGLVAITIAVSGATMITTDGGSRTECFAGGKICYLKKIYILDFNYKKIHNMTCYKISVIIVINM